MNTLNNKNAKDPFDKLIFEDNLRAKQLVIDKGLDMILVVFNNGKLLKLKISDYPKLSNAKEKELLKRLNLHAEKEASRKNALTQNKKANEKKNRLRQEKEDKAARIKVISVNALYFGNTKL